MKTFSTAMTKAVYVFAGAMMVFGMFGSGSAFAEVKTVTYPGTMCQPYNPGGADKIRYTTEGVYNSSTSSSVTLKCPVPAMLNGKLGGVIVDVKDYSDSATITCMAYIRKLNGQLVHSQSANSDQYFGGNNDVFMTSISYGGYNGVAKIYNLSCSLPKKLSGVPAFSIIAYHVTEIDID